ncbi:NAD(P)-binding protein [Viridothelium virens]|uniref:NAD(P)-binding protein n=1 Tax=Viridothelium virens TaxID=1048519 RepID=A0A6A6GZB2_VIRVR|nr:NAD(P)-binding protein [Viridothelium virens]
MAQFRIDGFTVIIGGTGGIGKETGFTFAESGVKGILFADVDGVASANVAEESKQIATNSKYKALSTKIDIADAQSVQEMVDLAVKEFGRIDYCINAAGVDVAEYIPATETSEVDYDRVMDINAKGAFLVGRAVAKIMKEQDPISITLPRHGARNLGRGSIVNVASAMSYGVVPAKLPYATSKHALLGITRALAMDLKGFGIRVNQVSPIWVKTPMFEEECRRVPSMPEVVNKIVPTQRAVAPDEVASAIQYLCGPSAVFVNGSGLLLDAGLLLGPTFA